MVERTRRREWRIGELAAATGLTVRTLHHYEQIGLLAAAARTQGRQRLYDEDDVRRLYRIRALRDLGLSLPEIRRMLGGEGGKLAEVLRAHLARVDAELARLGRLRVLLERAGAHARRTIDPDDALAMIEAMSHVTRRAQARAMSDEAKAHWRALGRQLRKELRAGRAPSSPRVRKLARAAQERIVEFAGGDHVTLQALARLRRVEPPAELAGWDAELLRYLDRALAALREGHP